MLYWAGKLWKRFYIIFLYNPYPVEISVFFVE